MIDHLRAAGAKTIAMDIEFAHPTDPRDDDALAEAIGRAHGKTVLAATEVGQGGSNGILGGEGAAARIGRARRGGDLDADSDGAVRRFAYSYSGLQSFAVVTAEIATGHRIRASLFEGGTLPIDFAGPPGTIGSISYSKVLRTSSRRALCAARS